MLIKKWILSGLVIGLMSLSGIAQASQKIAVVDWEKVWLAAPQKEVIEQDIMDEFAERIEEIKSLQSDFNGKLDKAKRDEAIMTPDQKLETKRELEELQDRVQRRQKALREDQQRRVNEELYKLRRFVLKLINDIGKKNNYDLVFSSDAIFYAKESNDITDLVVDAIKKPTAK